jgi:repressor of nif and glnA expression
VAEGYQVVEAYEISHKDIEILKALSESPKPMSSSLIKRELEKRGVFVSERTIRYHLKILELKGLVSKHDQKGKRVITEKGLDVLSSALVSKRVGFVTTRFLSMAYSVTYDPSSNTGNVVANVLVMDKKFCDKALEFLELLNDADLLLAPYVKVIEENEEYHGISVSEGRVALLTVCDLTIDGVLIRSGVPVFFKYGGLVQMVNRRPLRFVELISYEGTTIPPLELLVRSRLTSVAKVLRTGTGTIPVAMREIIAEARDRTIQALSKLKEKGWKGILSVSAPDEPALGVPVSMGRFGLCMIGGLTPGAALLEEGIEVEVFGPHCLVPLEMMKKV